ncbi:PqqD family protein [Candidatus Formimonas warabiya]|uniref:PqqD family protein n=1 Tax=Formimonas warabiya TaxID=1761012 RepID=UPI0011D155D8|nr:PqqD family protein [Candidatus Formimonas warabiya]
MKIKEGYILREVAGNSVVVAVGKTALDFNGLITLNSTGVFLWKMLEKDADEQALVAAMLREYEIDAPTAKTDIAEFIDKLKGADLLA